MVNQGYLVLPSFLSQANRLGSTDAIDVTLPGFYRVFFFSLAVDWIVGFLLGTRRPLLSIDFSKKKKTKKKKTLSLNR